MIADPSPALPAQSSELENVLRHLQDESILLALHGLFVAGLWRD
jgi:hypothetical protein